MGFYGHYKIEQWFYPGRQTIISQNEIPFFQMQSATQAVSVPDRLRADTKLVVKNTDQVSRRQTEEIKSLPLRLIGCSRKKRWRMKSGTIRTLRPLPSCSRGFSGWSWFLFSPQQIVVSKTYRKLQQAETFFLQIEENRVIVYEEDSRVLYLQTAIDARTLPSEVRRQILNGWHGVSKAELEKFLVSQTET